MSNELAVITPKTIEEVDTLSKRLAVAMVAVPEALRGKPADVMAIIMRGSELGFPPMTALAAFQIIKGRVTLSAEAMAALVRRNRDVCEYLTLKETTALQCVVITRRKGDPQETTFIFTMDDAKAAGLLGNENWKRFPAAMLRARALSGVCKAVYSDLVLGLYDADEIAAEPALPATQPPPPPANIVEGTVVPAKPSPPERQRKLVIETDAKPTEGQRVTGEIVDPNDAIVDSIKTAKTKAELTDIRRARGGANWPDVVLAEWNIRWKEVA